MGTEVLRPQDFLTERLRVNPAVFPRRRSVYANARPNRKQAVRPDRLADRPKRNVNSQSEPLVSKASSSDNLKSTKNNNSYSYSNSNNLVMGQVVILRRGESLDSKIKSEALMIRKDGHDDVLILSGTERLGPDPEMLPKQVTTTINDIKPFLSPVKAARSDVYAGSAFSLSPSPRALPLPSFSKKKLVSEIIDDSATRDLRRLLRLD